MVFTNYACLGHGAAFAFIFCKIHHLNNVECMFSSLFNADGSNPAVAAFFVVAMGFDVTLMDIPT